MCSAACHALMVGSVPLQLLCWQAVRCNVMQCAAMRQRGASATNAASACPHLPSVPLLCNADDRLLIETDCPYLTPRSITPSKARPQRNEPALLPHVLAAVAAARGETPERTAQLTTANARALFRLPCAL